ncbi:hypothetical protein G6F43_006181 [Rhizopus delemar]|nr:hypothetical protein G6F43_006181 [Rhizopus delemar]
MLDTHYLNHHRIVLTILNNYEAGLHSQLKEFEILLRDDCDPLDPNNLGGLFFDDFDQDEKECTVFNLFVQRIIRAI